MDPRSTRVRRALPFTVFGTTFAVLASVALASPPSDTNGPPGHGGRRKPPPFAYEACEGLAEQGACTVELPDGNALTGTCVADENGALFCLPDHMPAPPKGAR